MTSQTLVPLDDYSKEWLREREEEGLSRAEIIKKIPLFNVNYSDRHVPWEGHDNLFFAIKSEFNASDNYSYSHKVWDLKDIIGHTKPTQIVADFYLLEAIASGVLTSHLHDGLRPMSYNWELLNAMFANGLARKGEASRLQAVMDEGLKAFTELVIKNAPVFYAYSKFAIVTELYYSKGMHAFVPIETKRHFNERNRTIIEAVGVSQWAEWASQLFTDHKYGTWSGSYGGQPWGNCADVVRMYADRNCEGMPFTEREFLDRVFSLRHNSGTFLNKYEWNGSLSPLDQLLDAHANSYWGTLTCYASDKTKRLFGRYLAAYGDTTIINLDEYHNKIHTETKKAYEQELMCVSPQPEAQEELPNVKQMTACYAGVCKTSGKVINTGDDIIWHGKGMGASLLKEYVK